MAPILDQPETTGNRNAKLSLRLFLTGIATLIVFFLLGAYFASKGLVGLTTNTIYVALIILTPFLLFVIGMTSGIKAFRRGERPKSMLFIGLIGNGLFVLLWVVVILVNVLDILAVMK